MVRGGGAVGTPGRPPPPGASREAGPALRAGQAPATRNPAPGVLVLGPLRSSAAAAHELLFGDFFAVLLEPGIFLDRSCATGGGHSAPPSFSAWNLYDPLSCPVSGSSEGWCSRGCSRPPPSWPRGGGRVHTAGVDLGTCDPASGGKRDHLLFHYCFPCIQNVTNGHLSRTR